MSYHIWYFLCVNLWLCNIHTCPYLIHVVFGHHKLTLTLLPLIQSLKGMTCCQVFMEISGVWSCVLCYMENYQSPSKEQLGLGNPLSPIPTSVWIFTSSNLKLIWLYSMANGNFEALSKQYLLVMGYSFHSCTGRSYRDHLNPGPPMIACFQVATPALAVQSLGMSGCSQ